MNEKIKTADADYLISVIIPIYNRAHTIRRAVDSVLRQTYRNFELLLVDDGSTDDSFRICREYEKADGRVRAFHTENKGVSHARNLGLRQARGAYIRFVDSDDELPERSLEHLLAPVLADGTIDVVMACVNGDVNKIPAFSSRALSQKAFLERFFYERPLRFLYCGPWNKLYLASIIKEHALLFDESMHYSEDVHFNFRYYKYIAKAYVSGEIVYRLHHPRGEAGHLSGREKPGMEDRVRYAIMLDGAYKDAAARVAPNCGRFCVELLVGAMWDSMSLLTRHMYAVCSEMVLCHDWKNLLSDCRVDSFRWGYKFLYRNLKKGNARRIFRFFCMKNRLARLLPHSIKAALRPYITVQN